MWMLTPGGERRPRREHRAFAFKRQRFDNHRHVRVFRHQFFQQRIKLFAVRTVVVGKIHQRQFCLFCAKSRTGRIVKQRLLNEGFDLFFLLRGKRRGIFGMAERAEQGK